MVAERFEPEPDLLRTMLELGPDGLLLVNSEGQIVLANAQALRLFGYERAELLGAPVEKLVPERFRIRHVGLRQRFATAPETRPMGGGQSLYGCRKDGSEFPADISLSPIRAKQGSMVLASIRDITERQLAEALFRDQERRLMDHERAKSEFLLKEADRLAHLNEFKAQFLNMVAHDLNNVLTPLNINAHLMRRELERAGITESKAAEIMDRCVKRLVSFLGDLLDAARLQSDKLKISVRPFDIAAKLQEITENVAPQAEEQKLRVTPLLPPKLGAIGDPLRLEQVAMNLLSNALKFTPPGGEIRVEAKPLGDHVQVTVQDNGQGIAAENIGNLFQPFSKIGAVPQQQHTGTGLGLYISRGIVEAHGGKIWCESPGLGKGASFHFMVPATTGPPI